MRLLCATLLLVLGAGCGGVASPGASAAGVRQSRSMLSSGEVRNFITYRPATVAPGGAPLVIVLHGVPSSGAGMESLTRFDQLADTQGFEVVYPDAVPNPTNNNYKMWRLGCCDAFMSASTDVTFIGNLIDTLASQDRINAQRVYVMGFSWGAGMTYRLGCELSSKIAAIASVGGYLKSTKACQPDRPVSVYEIHGTNDYYNGTCGGGSQSNTGCKQGDPGYAPSVRQLNAMWRSIDGCGNTPSSQTTGNITVEQWQGCSQASAVRLDTIQNGTHCYPSVGSTSCASFDATRQIWDSFSPRRLAAAGFPPGAGPGTGTGGTGGTGGGSGGGTGGGGTGGGGTGGGGLPPVGVPVPLPVGTSAPPTAVAARCLVPSLTGKTLAQARASLHHAGCAVGAVRRPRHALRGQRLVVWLQGTRAGIRRSGGAHIGLTLRAASHAARRRV